MPVLALWGTDDALVPNAVGHRLVDVLPNGQFHQLAGCGHLPTLEKPAQSAALFSSFLHNAYAGTTDR